MTRQHVLGAVLVLAWGTFAAGVVIDPKMHHLRHGEAREWEEFAERAEGPALVVKFAAEATAREFTLRLRHRDLRHTWEVLINGHKVARLPTDENEMVTCWPVRGGVLRDGENELRIGLEAAAVKTATPDDVMIGEVELIGRPAGEVLSEATLEVEVTEEGRGVPCRITIADARGALVALGTRSNDRLAVRPGVVYCADGRAGVRLPAGKYVVYAGRGFEYSMDSSEVEVRAGESVKRNLAIRRVVPTVGWVSCDTHIHTLTYSRHGDATVAERMLTIAGEGIELPVSSEHNLQVDYGAAAETAGVRKWFTPVMGNEVTTGNVGHFNVFPAPAGAKLIDWRVRDWDALSASIEGIAPGAVVVLNHARDIHGGFRPFDPSRHVAVIGQPRDGKFPPANAMEVVNSGATQTDAMRLYRDWFGLLNRGRKVTPIGASDSHDVSRYIVGQGRTYVRCDDADLGRIDVAAATKALLEGRVMVSYGLLTEIKVNAREGEAPSEPRLAAPGTPARTEARPPIMRAGGPGDLVWANGDVEVEAAVLGPGWTRAEHVGLYANGVLVREEKISDGDREGVKWRGTWVLPKLRHDVWFAVVARGPGVKRPYWPTAKAYQPTSPRWEGYVMGSSGAVWVDGDGSGRFESAYEIASGLVGDDKELSRLRPKLEGFDEAIVAQAAGIIAGRSPDSFAAAARKAMEGARPAVRRGLESFLREWQ